MARALVQCFEESHASSLCKRAQKLSTLVIVNETPNPALQRSRKQRRCALLFAAR